LAIVTTQYVAFSSFKKVIAKYQSLVISTVICSGVTREGGAPPVDTIKWGGGDSRLK